MRATGKFVFIALLVAIATVFTGCDPKNDGITELNNGNGGDDGGDDALYYSPDDDDLDRALRNVHFKYSYQNPRSINCKEVVQAEAMACKGRSYIHGTHYDASDFCEDGYNNYIITSFEPPLIKCYSLDDNEWFELDSDNYYNYSMLDLGLRQVEALQRYFRYDKPSDYWDEPLIDMNYIKTTTWRENEAPREIAGVQCLGYSIYEKTEAGTAVEELLLHRAWYDPEKNVTMRFEEYNSDNELYYWFEITEIEYGNVTASDIDAILDDYLQTHNPTDFSNSEEAGTNW